MMQLQQSLSFRIEVLASRWTSTATKVCASVGDLRLREWRVLAAVIDNASITPAQVCEIAALDKAGVSRAVESLAANGFLTVTPDSTDARRQLLKATSAGKALTKKVSKALEKAEALLLEESSAAEKKALAALISE